MANLNIIKEIFWGQVGVYLQTYNKNRPWKNEKFS